VTVAADGHPLHDLRRVMAAVFGRKPRVNGWPYFHLIRRAR
jgi:hypothetical protein